MKRNYVALVIGLVFALSAMICLYSRIEFRFASAAVIGKVVHNTHGGHHPRIAFESQSGQRIEFRSGSWTSLEPGQNVPVRYRPDDPRSTATIDSFAELYWLPVLLASMAALWIIGGLRGIPFQRGRYS